MPQEISQEEFEARRAAVSADINRPLPRIGISFSQQQLNTLLQPDIPKEPEKHGILSRLWVFSGASARHFQLSNIPTPEDQILQERMVYDTFMVAGWDINPDYLDARMTQIAVNKLLAPKSISYTGVPRERDALNESRLTQIVRDERALPPKDHGGFFSWLRRGR